ncbi:hypothetical protein [Nonomuraea dietziae]|uniref:hypothetical protein n=1 Tax=Nonomuraea dietziae TaxID=65515 RepID=UPI003CD0B7BD
MSPAPTARFAASTLNVAPFAGGCASVKYRGRTASASAPAVTTATAMGTHRLSRPVSSTGTTEAAAT